MSRINGPVWKTSRRLGFSILETGEELQKRAYAPGQHGPTKRVKLTNYGQQLRENPLHVWIERASVLQHFHQSKQDEGCNW